MAFLLGGEVSPEHPGHDLRVVPAQTRAAYSLGRIPIGGSFGISNRSDKKSVFYKSVSQPL